MWREGGAKTRAGVPRTEPSAPTAEFKVCVNTLEEDRAPRLALQRESSDSERELRLFEMENNPAAAVCLVYCSRSRSSN